MRFARSEHVVLTILLVVPLVVAFIGWPAFVKWAVGPAPQPTPGVAGPAGTSQASEPTVRPPAGVRPTVVAQATPTARALAASGGPTAAPTVVLAQPTTPPGSLAAQSQAQPSQPQPSNDPGATVQDFYALVAQHDFASAAALWSPRMRASFPPQQNIDGRFSQTQSLAVNRADIVSQDGAGGQAAVAVDLTESTPTGRRHWVGTWYLVRGPSGWLLDRPQLQSD